MLIGALLRGSRRFSDGSEHPRRRTRLQRLSVEPTRDGRQCASQSRLTLLSNFVILRGNQPRCQRVSLEENLQLEQCDRQDVERPEARTGEACLPGARSVRRGTRWTKGNRSCPHGSLPAHQCRVAGVVGSWLLGANTNQDGNVFSGANPPLNGWNSLPSNTAGIWPDFPVAGTRCSVDQISDQRNGAPRSRGVMDRLVGARRRSPALLHGTAAPPLEPLREKGWL